MDKNKSVTHYGVYSSKPLYQKNKSIYETVILIYTITYHLFLWNKQSRNLGKYKEIQGRKSSVFDTISKQGKRHLS